MAITVHEFDRPDRFVVGTVGQPGQRSFFLQAKQGARVISVGMEKQQVSVLGERVEQLLDEARRRNPSDHRIPAATSDALTDSQPLDLPVDEEFRVGTITLSWEPDNGLVAIELFPVSEEIVVDEEDLPDGTGQEIEIELQAEEVLSVKIEATYARSFARRAAAVVSAGRPPCQFCGNPVDPEGHLCPRQNGFKRVAE